MFEEALESRLRAIEEEITRVTKLAAESADSEQQDNYFRLAQDLQREARELRNQIKKGSHAKRSPHQDTRSKNISLVSSV